MASRVLVHRMEIAALEPHHQPFFPREVIDGGGDEAQRAHGSVEEAATVSHVSTPSQAVAVGGEGVDGLERVCSDVLRTDADAGWA